MTDLRFDAGERDVHGLDGGQTLVQGTDFVCDGEVDGSLDRDDGGVGALVKLRGGHSECSFLFVGMWGYQ